MSDAPQYDLKRCAKCGAYIPRMATKCAYCQTSQPDEKAPRRAGAGISLRAPKNVSVTTILIWINVAFYVWSLYLHKVDRPSTGLLKLVLNGPGAYRDLRTGAPTGALVWAGWYEHALVFGGGQWWRVMTATFLHGGLIHIGFNMYALHQLGRIAESIFGAARYLGIYLICGACSTLAITVWFVYVPGTPAPMPMVGASGAIFGIAGLLIVFLKRRGTARGQAIASSLWSNILILLVLGFFMQFISNTGHVGGLIPGMLFGLFCAERFRDRLTPEADRNWTLVAAAAAAATTIALAQSVLRVLPHIG